MPTNITEDSSGSSGSSRRNSSTQPTKDLRRKPFSRKSHSASVNVASQRSGKPTHQGTYSYSSKSHFVGYCTKFAACPPDQRRTHALTVKLCFNCLNSNHSVETLDSVFRIQLCWILSQESFLTEHVAQALSLRKAATNTVVSGMGGEPTVVAKHTVKVALKFDYNSDFDFQFSALFLRSPVASFGKPKKTTASLGRTEACGPAFWISSESRLYLDQCRVRRGYSP